MKPGIGARDSKTRNRGAGGQVKPRKGGAGEQVKPRKGAQEGR